MCWSWTWSSHPTTKAPSTIQIQWELRSISVWDSTRVLPFCILHSHRQCCNANFWQIWQRKSQDWRNTYHLKICCWRALSIKTFVTHIQSWQIPRWKFSCQCSITATHSLLWLKPSYCSKRWCQKSENFFQQWRYLFLCYWYVLYHHPVLPNAHSVLCVGWRTGWGLLQGGPN